MSFWRQCGALRSLPIAKPLEVRYAGLSFAVVHRDVFDITARHFDLALCNTHLGLAFRPWFLPLVTEEGGKPRYLPGDYAFCERARQCGFEIMADPSLRLSSRGLYNFS